MQFEDLKDERDQTIKISCWTTEEWMDDVLEWNPNQFEGVQDIHIPYASVWQPDTYLQRK